MSTWTTVNFVAFTILTLQSQLKRRKVEVRQRVLVQISQVSDGYYMHVKIRRSLCPLVSSLIARVTARASCNIDMMRSITNCMGSSFACRTGRSWFTQSWQKDLDGGRPRFDFASYYNPGTKFGPTCTCLMTLKVVFGPTFLFNSFPSRRWQCAGYIE